MSDDKNNDTDKKDAQKKKKARGSSAKKAFSSGKSRKSNVLFQEDELDIYCNKMTKEAFIFHGKTLDYKNLERMVYDPEDYSVTVFLKDGKTLDLGVKIQWLIRPHFSKAEEVQIVRTQDGEAVDGTFVPITHKEKD